MYPDIEIYLEEEIIPVKSSQIEAREKPRRRKREEKMAKKIRIPVRYTPVEPRGFLAIMENRDGSGANRAIDCRIGFEGRFDRRNG